MFKIWIMCLHKMRLRLTVNGMPLKKCFPSAFCVCFCFHSLFLLLSSKLFRGWWGKHSSSLAEENKKYSMLISEAVQGFLSTYKGGKRKKNWNNLTFLGFRVKFNFWYSLASFSFLILRKLKEASKPSIFANIFRPCGKGLVINYRRVQICQNFDRSCSLRLFFAAA